MTQALRKMKCSRANVEGGRTSEGPGERIDGMPVVNELVRDGRVWETFESRGDRSC
jgi:hypothetical protein